MRYLFKGVTLLSVLLSLSFSPAPSAPRPNAPLCPTHDPTKFHTLWDAARGCHYDHEHGVNPFTPAVERAFPDFDLRALLGGVEIGHGYPTSPAENTTKHGGFKWFVMLANPGGCVAGFEDAQWCVKAAVIQYHAFGDYSLEMEGRSHSVDALIKMCDPAQPTKCGRLFVIAHPDFGQRVVPYQGQVLSYPDSPSPAYRSDFGPYFTTDCVGSGLPGCRPSLAYLRDRNLNANSIWTSKQTGPGERPLEATLFQFLFRVRDTTKVLDSSDLTYPYRYLYVCGGETYNPVGCRYNNSTTQIHEVAGTVPAAWDGANWDTDTRPGRVTGSGMFEGYPFKAVGALVGDYGSELSGAKISNPDPTTNPERDIYFCGNVVCAETDRGAVPSGWLGQNN